MSNEETEAPREDAPNPTQEAIDEGGPEDRPTDTSWSEEAWGETEATPHQGEEGQAGDVA